MSSTPPLLSISRSQVPHYLHSSELYQSLTEDDDDIFIPGDCFKSDPEVNTVADLLPLLLTMRFWILTSFPFDVIEFLVSTKQLTALTEVTAILSPFDNNFPGTCAIVENLSTTPHECDLAAQYGRVDFLKYFVSFGKRLNRDTMRLAAMHGHVDCLRYVHDRLTAERDDFILDNDLCWELIEKTAHVDCVKFLVEHGAKISNCMVYESISFGHTPMVKYLVSILNFCTSWTAVEAAARGDLDVLRCVVEHGCEINGTRLWNAVLKAEKADCLLYLLDTFGLPADAVFKLPAAACAPLPSLELLLAYGYSFSPKLVVEAAHAGNIPCLQFHKKRLGFEYLLPTTMAAAASRHHITLIQWLHKHGCPWDETAPTAAARVESIECLEFFIELRGVPTSADFQNAMLSNLRCRQFVEEYRRNVLANIGNGPQYR